DLPKPLSGREAITLLEDLRSEGSLLARQVVPADDPELARWRQRVRTAVSSIFGPRSRELLELDAIESQFPRAGIDRSVRRALKIASRSGKIPAGAKIKNPQAVVPYPRSRITDVLELL